MQVLLHRLRMTGFYQRKGMKFQLQIFIYLKYNFFVFSSPLLILDERRYHKIRAQVTKS
jgi:hypothetical protein